LFGGGLTLGEVGKMRVMAQSAIPRVIEIVSKYQSYLMERKELVLFPFARGSRNCVEAGRSCDVLVKRSQLKNLL